MGMNERDKKVEGVLVLTLALNWLVSIAKITLGFYTNALSVMADGFHSLFDGVSNISGIIGLRFASKPADEEHPYGHRKAEHIVAFFIAVLLALTAFTVLKGIYDRFIEPVQPHISALSFIVLLATLVVNLFVSSYEKRKGSELKSAILVADSLHTRADVFVTISVIAGIAAVSFGYAFADSIVAFLVVAFIARSALKIILSSANVLLDSSPIKVSDIEAAAMGVKGVKRTHAIKCRGDSMHAFIEMHIHVSGNISVKKGHDLSHEVKEKIMGAFPSVNDVTIHIEPDSIREKE